jgi:hypothetical protein
MRPAAAIVIALVSLVAANARAESDVQLWLEAGVAKKLSKRFELAFDQHLRFDEDLSRLQAIMPELTLSYRLHKMLKLALGYRFQYERDKNGELVIRHRGTIDVRPRYEIGPIELSLRARFQEEVRGSFASDDLRHTIRNRFAVALVGTKPWQPAISAEPFHRLGDGDTIRLQKVRLTAGVSYDFGDHEAEVYYRVEVAQDDPTDPTPHIMGVGYHYAL